MKNLVQIKILYTFIAIVILFQFSNAIAISSSCTDEEWDSLEGCCSSGAQPYACMSNDATEESPGVHYQCWDFVNGHPDHPMTPPAYELGGGTWHKGPCAISVSAPITVAGAISSWDFHAGHEANTGDGSIGGDFINGFCEFACSGTGYECPAEEPLVFNQISNPSEPLQCENLHFTGDSNACFTLAQLTCQHTTYTYTLGTSDKVDENGDMAGYTPPPPWVDPNPRGETVYNSFWWIPYYNPNQVGNLQHDPTLLMNQAVHVESIIGPQGESLDSVQYFYNMAIQELKNKNTAVPVKK